MQISLQRRQIQQVLISLPAIYSPSELHEIQVSTCNLGSSFCASAILSRTPYEKFRFLSA